MLKLYFTETLANFKVVQTSKNCFDEKVAELDLEGRRLPVPHASKLPSHEVMKQILDFPREDNLGILEIPDGLEIVELLLEL